MIGSSEHIQTLLQQGKNVLESMKDLKRLAHKKGKDRFNQREKFNANHHSFNVYTYIDSDVNQLNEVQAFKQKLNLFSKEFDQARYDLEGDVDVNRVESLYEEVLMAYNKMVDALSLKS